MRMNASVAVALCRNAEKTVETHTSLSITYLGLGGEGIVPNRETALFLATSTSIPRPDVTLSLSHILGLPPGSLPVGHA